MNKRSVFLLTLGCLLATTTKALERPKVYAIGRVLSGFAMSGADWTQRNLADRDINGKITINADESAQMQIAGAVRDKLAYSGYIFPNQTHVSNMKFSVSGRFLQVNTGQNHPLGYFMIPGTQMMRNFEDGANSNCTEANYARLSISPDRTTAYIDVWHSCNPAGLPTAAMASMQFQLIPELRR